MTTKQRLRTALSRVDARLAAHNVPSLGCLLLCAVLTVPMTVLYVAQFFITDDNDEQLASALNAATVDIQTWRATDPAQRPGEVFAQPHGLSLSLHGDPAGTWCLDAEQGNYARHVRGIPGSTQTFPGTGPCATP